MKVKKVFLYVVFISLLMIGFNVKAEEKCCDVSTGKIDNTKTAGSCVGSTYEMMSEEQCKANYESYVKQNNIYCCDIHTGKIDSRPSDTCPLASDHIMATESVCKIKYDAYIKSINKEHMGTDTDLSGVDCSDPDVQKAVSLIKRVYTLLKYSVPVILIILGSLDFGKAAIANNADEMEKNKKRFISRLGIAALVFLLMSIIQLIMGVLGDAGVDETQNWLDCWNSIK